MLFDLMMALQPTETHDITLKSLVLSRPKFCYSDCTNQIARFGKKRGCQIFNSNDAIDYILNEIAAAVS